MILIFAKNIRKIQLSNNKESCMFPVVMLLVFICSIELKASCRYGYSDPIFVCNYKDTPKAEKLKDYDGWNTVSFQNVTQILTLKDKKIITHGVTKKFNFDSDQKIPSNNIKIERVCVDVLHKDFPNKYAKLSPLEREYCEKYPHPTIIYPHDK